MKVYLLTHYRDEDEPESFKTIGIFSSEQKIEAATELLKRQPGFRDYPENFHVDEYELDESCWAEGFGFD